MGLRLAQVALASAILPPPALRMVSMYPWCTEDQLLAGDDTHWRDVAIALTGDILLTRMPSTAHSAAKDLTIATTAAFETFWNCRIYHKRLPQRRVCSDCRDDSVLDADCTYIGHLWLWEIDTMCGN